MDNILGLLFSKLGMLLGLLAVMVASYMFFQANKANTAISDVAAMSQGIQTLYGGSQFTTNLNNATVIAANVAPSDMVAGGNLTNPWGGTATVSVAATGPTFLVTETGVPTDGCVKMATGLSSMGVQINGGTALTAPIDPSVVATECNQSGSGVAGGNSIVYTFGH